ncbi:MAG: HlyC/CorC family transporter [Clostridia bacterium]|nr:HlyC/CorC family transporter [Clostridia bacterium]
MSGDSPRRLLIIALLAVFSAVVSYARGYLEAQNSKKLERDAQDAESPALRKLLRYILEHEQPLNDGLWAAQMLLLAFQALIFGVLCHDISDDVHAAGSLTGFPSVLTDVGIYLCGGLVFSFLYIVFVRRFFAAFGKAKGRKAVRYRSLRLARTLYYISLPFSALCNFVTRAIVRMLGFGKDALDENVTQDEILTLVDMGEENGAIEQGEKEMIENVFDFTDITAGDILTHRTAMTAVPLDVSEEDLLALIEETGYSRIPVYDRDVDKIVGILSTKLYLLNRLHKAPERKSLRELLYEPHFVPETVHATNLLAEMKKNKIHMAVVVDEWGGTAGIITMEDLLEEIVGNIYDETDDPATEDADIVPLEDGTCRVSGTAQLETLFETLGLNLPDDLDFDTLAGLVFSKLDVIPENGSTPEVDALGLHIKVEKIADRRIVSAIVSVNKPDEDEEHA